MKQSQHKQVLVALFLMLLATLFLPGSGVSAMSPDLMPAQMRVFISNAPNGAIGVDLLLKISTDGPDHITIHSDNLAKYDFTSSAGIVTYNQDGFTSYTFHFANALSEIRLQDDNYHSTPRLVFCAEHSNSIAGFYERYAYLVENYKTFKLAYIDESGEVLAVTDEFTFVKFSIWNSFYGDYELSGLHDMISSNGFVGSEMYNKLGSILLFTLIVVLIKILVMLCVLPKKKILFVVLVNFCAQILLQSWMFLTEFRQSIFTIGAILLCASFFVAEHFLYKWRFKDVTAKRLLIFEIISDIICLIPCFYALSLGGYILY